MDTANVFVLIWEFSEPRTALNIVMGDRGNPYIVYDAVSNLNGINPIQYVLPSCSLPHLNVSIGNACGKSIKIQTAMFAVLFLLRAMNTTVLQPGTVVPGFFIEFDGR